jgi:hypothetical protein
MAWVSRHVSLCCESVLPCLPSRTFVTRLTGILSDLQLQRVSAHAKNGLLHVALKLHSLFLSPQGRAPTLRSSSPLFELHSALVDACVNFSLT